MYWLAVVMGGACGALVRSLFYLFFAQNSASLYRLIIPTLLVNVIGSGVMGVIFALIAHHVLSSDFIKTSIVVGFLGSFTTFSTFSLDVLRLYQEGSVLQAVLYIVCSMLACLGSIALGYRITTFFL